VPKFIDNISFADKAQIYSHDYLRACVYITTSDAPSSIFTKKLYSKLVSSSHLLEDFLDFHGAKNNSNWYFYRELSAAVRQLSLGGYAQQHIANRLAFYELPDSETFAAAGEVTLVFLKESLIKLAPVILQEAKRLGLHIPAKGYNRNFFPGVITNEMLDYDIDDEDLAQQKRNVVKIASEFLDIAKRFDELGFYEPYDMEKILEIVPANINEVKVRRFEMLVHNLQSAFDSYVMHGGYRFGNRKLKLFRGYFSVVFHLLNIIGRLLHFYERHLYEVGYKTIYKEVCERLAGLIPPAILLDRTINYGLYYVCVFLNGGKKLAKEILNENIERSSIKAGIPLERGFHSRPSLMVAKIVQYYGGQVELCVGEDRYDASSVLDIQWAGGKIQKENIKEVIFEGDVRALRDIAILAAVNYGEDSMGKGIPLPKELSYLK
jgi:phosphotransferase system HPr-like phosphotransfer protein